MLRLPAVGGGDVTVHPYRLRAPFVKLLDVLQYQVVHRADGLLVRIVVRDSAPRDVADRVQSLVADALAGAGATLPVEVGVVPAIGREPGHAAKVKLITSEVRPPA